MTPKIEDRELTPSELAWVRFCNGKKQQFKSGAVTSYNLPDFDSFDAGYQAALPEWQDISTAPKDGTWVRLYLGENSGSLNIVSGKYAEGSDIDCGEDSGWTSQHVSSWNYQEYNRLNPTHWQPLPSPPKDTEQ